MTDEQMTHDQAPAEALLTAVHEETSEAQPAVQPEQPQAPVAPAVSAEQARLARCQGRAEQLFSRYREQGMSEERARQHAWDDAVGEDALARENAQAMAREVLGPYMELLEREVLPGAMQREVAAVVGDDIPAADVLDVLSTTLNIPTQALSTLAPELRQSLYRLAKDAARGRQTSAPANIPPGSLTRNTARAAAPLDAQAQGTLTRLKRAFPSLTEKELAELL